MAAAYSGVASEAFNWSFLFELNTLEYLALVAFHNIWTVFPYITDLVFPLNTLLPYRNSITRHQ